MIESSLASYATQVRRDVQSKEDSEKLQLHRQDTLEKSIAIALNAARDAAGRQTSASRAEKRVRGYMEEVLDAVDFGLNENEKKKIEDRMINLLDEYARTPKEDRDTVYEQGEKQVLATLEPPARPQSASASW